MARIQSGTPPPSTKSSYATNASGSALAATEAGATFYCPFCGQVGTAVLNLVAMLVISKQCGCDRIR